MKTSKEVEEEFKAKLQALINEYDAEIIIEDRGGYIPNNVINFYIPPVFDKAHESASFDKSYWCKTNLPNGNN